MKWKYILAFALLISGATWAVFSIPSVSSAITQHQPGDAIDSFNGVTVFYNGAVNHTAGRNTGADGYNIGLKWQCVEFVKRYYYEYFNHKMPDSYGHAKDFFSSSTPDGSINKARNLIQYKNGANVPPAVNDIVVFGATPFNPYGHVAIVCEVNDHQIKIVQQNPGPFASSRASFDLNLKNGGYFVDDSYLLCWLHKK